MRTSLAIAAAVLTLVGLVASSRSDDAVSTIWLSDQAVAYVETGAQFAEPDLEGDPWELVEGTIRIACRDTVRLIAGGYDVVVDDGLVTITAGDRGLGTCVEEGVVSVDGHPFAAGDCVEAGPDGFTTVQALGSSTMIALSPAALDLHPSISGDPMLSLDAALGAIGVGSSGAAADGENVEAGGTAACLDSSSSGADAVGPDTPDIVAPEVDRDGHIVHVEVTLEDF